MAYSFSGYEEEYHDGEEVDQAKVEAAAKVIEQIEELFAQAKALIKQGTDLAKNSDLGSTFRIGFGEVGPETGEAWFSEEGWQSSWWN